MNIRTLLDESPRWSEDLVPELYNLCQNHAAIRSALMYALELARMPELGLRRASTIEEVKHLQGQVAALETYANHIISQMEALEAPTEIEE